MLFLCVHTQVISNFNMRSNPLAKPKVSAVPEVSAYKRITNEDGNPLLNDHSFSNPLVSEC